MSNRLPVFFKHLKKVRVSHVKAAIQDPAKTYGLCLGEIRLKQAMYQRVMFAKKPSFANINGSFVPSGGPLAKLKAEQFESAHKDYVTRMNKLKQDIEDPSIYLIAALAVALANFLEKAVEEEERQDNALAKLEADLDKDIATLIKDKQVLKDLNLTEAKLKKEADTWIGWAWGAAATQREEVIQEIAKVEKEIDTLCKAVKSRQASIASIKLEQQIFELTL
ncbi:hypothetical protein [Parasedimentitalea huanghaiensis]|uniref:Uncharacterized protein n=1 Tax=Parasedimentitalea huanghaiensis TaxID=2682100 RepID=A0A6L6WJE4_9RHOB|nr:hypothetical protein [Zongyanglinia huanghaiensis]MVO17099.1 hypothetical protein [Zongyanglinia huanghaiensis]